MKNRSFLFLIAALAMGLALFGCSTDSDDGGTTTNTVYQGWAGDVEDIAAAFDKVDAVYLTKGITVPGGQTLSIKAGKTLYLNGNTITMADNSSVIAASVNSIVWSGEERAIVSGKIVVADSAKVYLFGPDGAFPDASLTGDTANVKKVEPSATVLTYVINDDRAFAATSNRALVFTEATGAWIPNAGAAGGTRVVYIGDLEIPSSPGGYTIAGSLSVAGNVTLAGTLAGADGEIEVLGKLTSNISTDGVAGITLAAGKVTARSIATKGGIFAKDVAITAPSLSSLFEGTLSTFTKALTGSGSVQFTKDVEFTETATMLNNAEFGGDVTFAGDTNKIGGDVKFGNGKTVAGSVTVGGQLAVTGATGTTNTLLLGPGGQIIYGEGISTPNLSGVGTLAALSQGALEAITVSFSPNELAVSGAGSLVIGKTGFTLSGNNQIKIDGTTGVYFSETGGSIATETYELGGVAGTLSDGNGADGGFILTKDSIINTATNGSASLTYTGAENSAASIILKVLPSQALTISDVNIDLSANTGGSISLGGGSASIILTGAGSITTAADTNTVAWGGVIYTDYVASGSLVAGSLDGYSAGGSITAAGSVGTTGGNYITQNGSFAILNQGITNDVIQTAIQKASTAPVAAVSQDKGSIAVFQISSNP